MDKFTHDTFKSLLNLMDDGNNQDFMTFIDAMSNQFDVLFDSDVEDVVDYITDYMGLESDMEVANMSGTEIGTLSKYINGLVEEIYDDVL